MDTPVTKKKRRPVKRYPTALLEQALRESKGLVSVAARLAGCTPHLIYKRMCREPRLRQVLEEARCELIDQAEQALRDAVCQGQPWAVTLVLKTLGKDRGYVERQEVINTDAPAYIVARVIRVSPEEDQQHEGNEISQEG